MALTQPKQRVVLLVHLTLVGRLAPPQRPHIKASNNDPTGLFMAIKERTSNAQVQRAGAKRELQLVDHKT